VLHTIEDIEFWPALGRPIAPGSDVSCFLGSRRAALAERCVALAAVRDAADRDRGPRCSR
jgi:hypothetical protein